MKILVILLSVHATKVRGTAFSCQLSVVGKKTSVGPGWSLLRRAGGLSPGFQRREHPLKRFALLGNGCRSSAHYPETSTLQHFNTSTLQHSITPFTPVSCAPGSRLCPAAEIFRRVLICLWHKTSPLGQIATAKNSLMKYGGPLAHQLVF